MHMNYFFRRLKIKSKNKQSRTALHLSITISFTVSFVLLSKNTNASSEFNLNLLEFHQKQMDLVQDLNTQINCRYPLILLRQDIIDKKIVENNFQMPDMARCNSVTPSELSIKTQALEAEKSNLEKRFNFQFPLYSSVLDYNDKNTSQLKNDGLSDFVFAPIKRELNKAIIKDPAQIETHIRNQWDVINPTQHLNEIKNNNILSTDITNTIENTVNTEIFFNNDSNHNKNIPKSQCSLSTDKINSLHTEFNLKMDIYNNAYWFSLLSLVGYDCTIDWYVKQSDELNTKIKNIHNQTSDPQTTYSKILNASPNQLNSIIRGQTFILIPQLGYDIPDKPNDPERERLSYKELGKYFSQLGARLVVIGRATLDSKDNQVSVTRSKILDFIKNDSGFDKKYTFLSRSMGTMILREVIESTPELIPHIKGVVTIGGTPYGSVIADFKSRADLFDDVIYMSQNFISGLLKDPVGSLILLPRVIFDRDTKKFLETIKFRLNYETMSHNRFKPQLNEKLNFPLVNVLLLPRNLKNYFNGSSRIAEVDFTFLHMMMYGPTEGSSPLAHASWDTQNSYRIIESEYNHLAFWQWDEPYALKVWLSAIGALSNIKP